MKKHVFYVFMLFCIFFKNRSRPKQKKQENVGPRHLLKSDLVFRFYGPSSVTWNSDERQKRVINSKTKQNSALESVLINSWESFRVSKLLFVSKRLMWDPGLHKTNARMQMTSHELNQDSGQIFLHQLVVPMVATSWHGHFDSA